MGTVKQTSLWSCFYHCDHMLRCLDIQQSLHKYQNLEAKPRHEGSPLQTKAGLGYSSHVLSSQPFNKNQLWLHPALTDKQKKAKIHWTVHCHLQWLGSPKSHSSAVSLKNGTYFSKTNTSSWTSVLQLEADAVCPSPTCTPLSTK